MTPFTGIYKMWEWLLNIKNIEIIYFFGNEGYTDTQITIYKEQLLNDLSLATILIVLFITIYYLIDIILIIKNKITK
jgi:hypothetical protein